MQPVFSPEAQNITDRRFEGTRKLLREGVEDGVFPGAVFLVAQAGEVLFYEACGAKSVRGAITTKGAKADPLPMTVDTVFDIASLTAGVSTALMIMKLVEGSSLALKDKVLRYIQGFGVFGKSGITLETLLAHTSGLPQWKPLFEELVRKNCGERLGILTSRGARDYIQHAIVRSELKYDIGSRHAYSDLGLILLGFLIELMTGFSLDRAFHKLVAQPLGLKSTSFIDLSRIRRRGIHPITDLIAPTEECPWRKRILCGEVHDDNAWVMGGIAGHSGLFSTAFDLHIVARELLFATVGDSSYLKQETILKFLGGVAIGPVSLERENQMEPLIPSEVVSGAAADPVALRAKIGWDSPNRDVGLHNVGFSSQAFGYNGFTGCSLWIDPESELEIILMSNRIHPHRGNKSILAFRPELFKAVLKVI